MKKKRKNKGIYDENLTMENLYAMWSIIRKTCKNKKELFYFSLNLNANIQNIYNVLKTRTYVPSKYRAFMIFEPKPRLVMSQSITDKLINHFVTNYYLIPCLEKSLLDCNVATRKGKGSSYGIKLLKKYFNKLLINNLNEEIFCLKIDISKYFYSIDHKILLKMLEKKIYDKDVINLIKIIISETNNDYINKVIKKYNEIYNIDIPYYIDNKGLSIGAMSSQFLAIYYLNEIDHYIKEELNCKHYIRYMDDFIILDTNKERLKDCYKKIKKRIEELNLKINKKSNIYRCSKGFSFIGYTYKVINNKLYISCNKDTYIRIQKKLSHLKKYDIIKYKRSLASYYGYFGNYIEFKRESFKVNLRELYKILKDEYVNCLIIIKDKYCYRTYDKDALVMSYLFNYKYVNNMVSFGNNAFDRIVNKLKELKINFRIFSKVDELLSYDSNENFYLYYCALSSEAYDILKERSI